MFVVSKPVALVEDVEQLRELVTSTNKDILLKLEFPTGEACDMGECTPEQLIGDPNENLSDDLCQELVEVGVLNRVPDMNKGVQRKFLDGTLSWSYSWGENTFLDVSEELVTKVAWDLRHHKNFSHVNRVEDKCQREVDMGLTFGIEFETVNKDNE